MQAQSNLEKIAALLKLCLDRKSAPSLEEIEHGTKLLADTVAEVVEAGDKNPEDLLFDGPDLLHLLAALPRGLQYSLLIDALERYNTIFRGMDHIEKLRNADPLERIVGLMRMMKKLKEASGE